MEPTSSLSTRGMPTNCHDTALCLIPPRHLWPSIERLRSRYDAAYEKWPPHINLVYPFVSVTDLPEAVERILSHLRDGISPSGCRTLDIQLNAASFFKHKRSNTLYLHDRNPECTSTLVHLRSLILYALGHYDTGDYAMHMSVGQSADADSDSHKFLMEKLAMLPAVQWTAGHLVVLIRDREQSGSSMMRFWGAIDLQEMRLVQDVSDVALYKDRTTVRRVSGEEQVPSPAYTYSGVYGLWKPAILAEPGSPIEPPGSLIIASYNVLAEFTYPPSQVRYPLLVDSLLGNPAAADILVLQEVTDDFLTYLLANDDIRDLYGFVSHGPSNQQDLEPLPSLLNQVILSKFPFNWRLLPLKRQHKTSLVATFPTIGKHQADGFNPLVLATCHLSRGLTDGAVLAKKGELKRTVEYLQREYRANPWVIAGDFNLATSRYTISAALERGSISQHTVGQIHSIDEMLSNCGLNDAWALARCEVGESSDEFRRPKDLLQTYEGEQGATFDPTENKLAAELTGSGLGNRPQRYDRILVKTDGLFHVAGFSMFGFPTTGPPSVSNDVLFGSDHWGVRCLLRTITGTSPDSASRAVPVSVRTAPGTLGDADELKEYLAAIDGLPTADDEAVRARALETLEAAIFDAIRPGSTGENQKERRGPPMVLTPVGSFGLGVWSSDSDVDCLCIGPFSSRTFFSVVTRYLRATGKVRVLRKVKANTGVMLELEVHGVRMDLQYCASTPIAERWPAVMKRPMTDPIWALPSQTLLKLKPARDMAYLRRSIPDLVQFRLAYLLIKSWAKEKGIYAAKFGYLGGIHIFAMLVPICKILFQQEGILSVSDIIATFFHHYAQLNWREHIVFDPFFHKRLRYVRTSREPLCLLGWHGPSLNTAVTASSPTVKTIAAQFRAADEHLGRDGVTWPTILGLSRDAGAGEKHTPGRAGAAEFLRTFRSYVRLDAHYWGLSREKRNAFVGWLGSRCVSVLVDIDRKVPDLVTRVWPARFVDAPNGGTDEESSMEYRGCYLMGLEWNEDGHDGRNKPRSEAAEGSLVGVLRQFESRIRGDEQYYDPKTSWMAATIVRANDVSGLELDLNEWGDVGSLGDDSDSDLEEEEDDTEVEDEQLGRERGLPTPGNRQAGTTKPPGAGKLRPASDVMNRLRWDDNMDSSDYVVGYEDRFAGMKEKDLADWKAEQTDDEFIPQHRIAYFKRRSDGVVVWDRVARVDLVFRSG